MPKDRVFYSLFEEVTGNLMQMGDIFVAALDEKDIEKRTQMLKMLEDLEHKNDEVTHRIFIELGSNFHHTISIARTYMPLPPRSMI